MAVQHIAKRLILDLFKETVCMLGIWFNKRWWYQE